MNLQGHKFVPKLVADEKVIAANLITNSTQMGLILFIAHLFLTQLERLDIVLRSTVSEQDLISASVGRCDALQSRSS